MAKYFTKEGDEFKEVESFSEQQLDEIAGDVPWLTTRLERARANERSKFGDYDELKTKAASVADLEKKHADDLKAATERATELEKQLGTAKLGTEKVKIMHEFKLPDEVDEFVTGDVEEMRKRAEKLSKTAGGKVPIKKNPKEGDNDASDSKKIAGKLFGKSDD